MLGALITIANARLNNESAYSIYIKHATKLKVKDIREVEGDGVDEESVNGEDKNKILVLTSSIIENRSLFGEKWTEISFSFKYDTTHEDAVERLENLGYEEFRKKGISIYDFMKIKSIGHNEYKFFCNDAISDIRAEGRLMDLEDYDDLYKIRQIYYVKKCKYEKMVRDAKWYTRIAESECEKENYKKDVASYEMWTNRINELPDETSSEDEGEGKEENADGKDPTTA